MHFRLGLLISAVLSFTITPLAVPVNPVTRVFLAPAVAQTAADQMAEADRLLQLCREQLQAKQFEAALQSCGQSAQQFAEIGDQSKQGRSITNMGIAHAGLRQYQQAIEQYQTALPLVREAVDREAAGIALVQLIISYSALNQYEQAIGNIQQLLTLAQETQNRAQEGVALALLSAAYAETRAYQQAIAPGQQALPLLQEVGNRNAAMQVLNRLSWAYQNISQYQEARDTAQQALSIAQELKDPDGEANALNNLGNAYLSLSQYQQAIEYYQQSVPIFQAVGNRNGEANALMNLGVAYGSLSQYQQAIEYYQQALPIFQTVGDRNGEAKVLNNFGTVYNALSQYRQAIEYHQQALTIFQQVGNLNGEANALVRLGLSHHVLSEYGKAIEFYQQSLSIYQQIGDRNNEAWTLNNLGLVHQNLGQYQQAIQLLEQALPIFRQIGDRNGEAATLHNLGVAYWYLNQPQRTIELLQQALPIFQEIGDHSSAATVLTSLGYVYRSLNRYQEAAEYCQQALSIFQAIGDRNGEARVLGNLGLVYQSLNQYQQAIEYYQQSLSILQAVGDRETEGEVLAYLGELLAAQNQPELAIVFLKQSVNVRESIRDGIRQLSAELQQSYTNSVADDYRKLADLLLQQNRVLEAQRVLDLLKVQELDDYLQDVQRSSKTESGVDYWQPEQRILELYKTAILDGKELRQLEEKAQSTALTPPEQARFDQLNARQGELLDSFYQFVDIPEVQTAIQHLQQTNNSQSIELEQLQALQDNLRNLNQNAVLLYPLILDNRLELVLVTPNAPPIRRPVEVSAADLNRLIVAMGQALKDSSSDIKPIAQQLYDYLIQPLEADLQAADAKTIVYAPDGALRYIPLAALHDGKQWLAQRFAVTNITAASLTDFNAQPTYQQSNALRVLAAACVQCNFSFQVGERSFQFQDLTHAGTEVANLAAAIPNTETRINQAFNPDIVALMRQFPIVHLATHAAFVQGQPEESFIVLGSGDRMTTRDIRRWNITNTDLVVLSACETAVGESELGSGIEILGFGYQMQRAGAKSAIASLWQVSDGGTQILMNAFYTALLNGRTKAEAMQQAQNALITGDFSVLGNSRGNATVTAINLDTGLPASLMGQLDHPYYWAPFILIGNGL